MEDHGRAQRLPAVNASDCMTVKKKEREKCAGWVSAPQTERTHSEPHVFPLSAAGFTIQSLVGLKTGSPSALTSKQLNRNASSLSASRRGAGGCS